MAAGRTRIPVEIQHTIVEEHCAALFLFVTHVEVDGGIQVRSGFRIVSLFRLALKFLV
jgi:hypothetical protein